MKPSNCEGEMSEQRLPREDGTLGPPLKRPWRKWTVLNRADQIATGLLSVAIALCAGAVYSRSESTGFSLLAPIVAAAYFGALVIQFLERERHGAMRAILAFSAAVLAIGGMVFAPVESASRLFFFYWVPAILGIVAAIVLQRAHHKVGDRMTQARIPRGRTSRGRLPPPP